MRRRLSISERAVVDARCAGQSPAYLQMAIYHAEVSAWRADRARRRAARWARVQDKRLAEVDARGERLDATLDAALEAVAAQDQGTYTGRCRARSMLESVRAALSRERLDSAAERRSSRGARYLVEAGVDVVWRSHRGKTNFGLRRYLRGGCPHRVDAVTEAKIEGWIDYFENLEIPKLPEISPRGSGQTWRLRGEPRA